MANTIKLKRASGSDPGNSDLATGELAIRTSNCKLFSKNDSGSAIGVVAGSADTLTTARTIAGVSFDGSANISLNNNAITNGAGYLADIVSDSSPQLGGDLDVQSSKITTATSNGNVKIEPNGSGVVEVRGAGGNDGTLQLNCSAQSHGIKLKSPPHSAGASYTLTFPNTAGGSSGNVLTTDGSGNLSWTTPRTTENVQDIVGAMVTGNTETGITVTYQDGDGTIDFVVGTLNQNTTGSAATLTTARNIAGVAFDGSANISLNNNAITNGAGYITSSGTSAACSGNAATATKLASARTIAGVSFDGSANISLNNNAITNGAGYITSANGGNAATLDSIDSSQFLRSDTADTASGELTITGGLNFGADAKCAAGVSSLSDGSTITVPFNSGVHHTVTLGGNRTFGDPGSTSGSIGQSGSIFIVQDGTGSRTASFHSDYKFAGGTAPTLSTGANAVDRLDYVIRASDNVHCVVTLDVK